MSEPVIERDLPDSQLKALSTRQYTKLFCNLSFNCTENAARPLQFFSYRHRHTLHHFLLLKTSLRIMYVITHSVCKKFSMVSGFNLFKPTLEIPHIGGLFAPHFFLNALLLPMFKVLI